jgi:hypothetical protein
MPVGAILGNRPLEVSNQASAIGELADHIRDRRSHTVLGIEKRYT